LRALITSWKIALAFLVLSLTFVPRIAISLLWIATFYDLYKDWAKGNTKLYWKKKGSEIRSEISTYLFLVGLSWALFYFMPQNIQDQQYQLYISLFRVYLYFMTAFAIVLPIISNFKSEKPRFPFR